MPEVFGQKCGYYTLYCLKGQSLESTTFSRNTKALEKNNDYWDVNNHAVWLYSQMGNVGYAFCYEQQSAGSFLLAENELLQVNSKNAGKAFKSFKQITELMNREIIREFIVSPLQKEHYPSLGDGKIQKTQNAQCLL